MGFGLLFIGYTALLFFKVLPPAMFAGQCLCIAALEKLSAYEKSFRLPKLLSEILCGYFGLYTAVWIAQMAGLTTILSNRIFLVADDAVYKALLFAWHMALYAAMENICRTVGYEKGCKRAGLARVFLVTAYLVWGLRLVFDLVGSAGILPLAEMVFLLGYIGFTAAYIYALYMRIATPKIIEDEMKNMREYDAKYSFRTPKKK